MDGQARVTVTCPQAVKSAKVLPSARGIKPEISGSTFTFTVDKPGQLTIDVNGDWIRSLQLFVDPMEKDIPDPKDPKVIYFGPGIHKVESVRVGPGQTVYIAGGAVVYGSGEKGDVNEPIFSMQGSNITLRGRGIIDGSRCPWHTRSILGVTGSDVHMEGVVLRDSSGFTMPVRMSDRVKIDNLKIFGWRVTRTALISAIADRWKLPTASCGHSMTWLS